MLSKFLCLAALINWALGLNLTLDRRTKASDFSPGPVSKSDSLVFFNMIPQCFVSHNAFTFVTCRLSLLDLALCF